MRTWEIMWLNECYLLTGNSNRAALRSGPSGICWKLVLWVALEAMVVFVL